MTELLVTIVVGGLLLAAFSGFYRSQQATARHHQIEVETSQALRMALEQISRDLRSARKDLTRDPKQPSVHPGAGATFVSAAANSVEFQLDADDDGVVDPLDPAEHKGFSFNGGASMIAQLDASTDSWVALADNVSSLAFTYRDCSQNELTAPVASPDDIAIVDVAVTVTPVIAGLPVSRIETESVRLRNKVCP